jgi:hypothetical protein
VGYNESDDIRGQDATETFREIMILAKEHEVIMTNNTCSNACSDWIRWIWCFKEEICSM